MVDFYFLHGFLLEVDGGDCHDLLLSPLVI